MPPIASSTPPALEALRERWQAAWPRALAVWSSYTKLGEPTWCMNLDDERREGLTGSFAMIRLVDHRVVISLEQVEERGLGRFAVEILAHEIGHHVYAPADLADNARLHARVRAGLPTREQYAGLVANLYTDLLINDRLQRREELDIASVYRQLRITEGDSLWLLYMRIYEVLWSLPQGTLVEDGAEDARLRTDAVLGARVIRAYARHWLDGAGRFAALCLPYLLEVSEQRSIGIAVPWLDALGAGAGASAPDGLAGVDEDERDGALHPALDPDLSGQVPGEGAGEVPVDRTRRGGRKQAYRPTSEYLDLMRSLGIEVEESELVVRYYRELARAHIISFPTRERPRVADPLPEGLDVWDVGSPIHAVDWLETVVRSPIIVPGVTTVERTYGATEGDHPEREAPDLYLGVDCSGSMANPRYSLSYPVLAGAIMTLSALRAGARVMTTLSGEAPGRWTSTEGFTRSERENLAVLTDYLGTGYAFGIERLRDAFPAAPVGRPTSGRRPTHIIVLTDADIFYMLDRTAGGWEIAAEALGRAGAGGTMVLNLPQEHEDYRGPVARLRAQGWSVHFVSTEEELVAFARAFSKMTYDTNRK